MESTIVAYRKIPNLYCLKISGMVSILGARILERYSYQTSTIKLKSLCHHIYPVMISVKNKVALHVNKLLIAINLVMNFLTVFND